MTYPDIVSLAVPVFLILIVLEIILIRRRAKRSVEQPGRYDARDSFASLSMGLGNRIAGMLGSGAIAVVVFGAVHQVRLIETIPVAWWSILICFIADDLAYYWFHRIAHERRWFWASHIVHHSSQHYNLTTALRQTWTGKVSFSFIFAIPVIWIGFPPEMVTFVSGANLVYQFWIHTETIDRLGPFEWIFNTPSHHRVHHATNPEYLDANYAGTLIIWDRLFGTFIEERASERPRYGIVKNIGTFNPFKIAFHEWYGIVQDVRQAKSWREIVGYTFGPPGWSPDGSRMTSAKIKERWNKSKDRLPAE